VTTTLALVGHRDHLDRNDTAGFYRGLASSFDLRLTLVEDGWPRTIEDIEGHEEADTCLWFVRFRLLRERPAFDWGRFAGRRVMYDFDTNANYHLLSVAEHRGEWPGVYRRQGFDTLVSTGKAVSELLRADDVNAVWLAKGYDDERVHPLGRTRHGLGEYGQSYRSRRALRAHLERRRDPYTRFSDHAGLNDQLNRFLGVLICNLAGEVARGPGRFVNRVWPDRAIRLSPGVEPMIKNFEVAGAGCAPIADWIPELGDLGFVDGETMVAYDTLDDLVERCRHYLAEPDLLASIGVRAAALAAARHTWGHRAAALGPLLDAAAP
jgi:hypothetical protein